MAIPARKNPFKGLMPEEAEYYLEENIQQIKLSPMWGQFPEDPLQLTPVQQLQWFELLAREEAIRLLLDSQDYRRLLHDDYSCPDEIELPLRKVPKEWSNVLARLPLWLATFTKYHLTDLHKLAIPSRSGIHEGDVWVYVGNDGPTLGLNAVEAIIRKFLKEADAELFPVERKSAPANGQPALSVADQKLYKALGQENIATTKNRQLWESNRSQLGLRPHGYGAFKAQVDRIRRAMCIPAPQSISKAKKKSNKSVQS